jgi:DNA gyrase/topoisomerase IV subunit A
VPDAATKRLVPKIMSLKEVLEHYITHRHEVIVRRAQFELDKALEREHILEGLKIAVDNIDEVIKIIRAAADTPVASAQLQSRFKLSERQAEAILNMRLAKLTGLEIDKLEAELKEVAPSSRTCAHCSARATGGWRCSRQSSSRSRRSSATSGARRSRATRASSRSRTSSPTRRW